MPEVPMGEGVTGTGLEIPFELLRQFQRIESDIQLHFAGCKYSCMRALTLVVVIEALAMVRRVSDVMMAGVGDTLDYTRVIHANEGWWVLDH